MAKGQLEMASRARLLVGMSVTCFAASILMAMLLMWAIPTSFKDIEPGDSIWDRGVFLFVFRIGDMALYGHLLAVLFVLGISAFAGAVIQQLLLID